MASNRYERFFNGIGRGLDRASDKANPWVNEKADNFKRLGRGSTRFMSRVFGIREYDSPLLVTAKLVDGVLFAVPLYVVFNVSRRLNEAIFSTLARVTGQRRSNIVEQRRQIIERAETAPIQVHLPEAA